MDKVHGWWMGKIIGVTLGCPYEFKMPWPPKEIVYYTPRQRQCGYFGDDDDVYVNLVYLLAAEKYGSDLSQEEMGEEFLRRLEPQRIWCANKRAYMNLFVGLPPPKTGHPVFNEWSWAIDAQIDNDIWGVVSPGMVNTACDYADKAAHITNYANGAYGGIFAAAMASSAFFETDVNRVIEKALEKVPPDCDYYKAVRDVINWQKENPENWQATREKIKTKWQDMQGKKDVSAVVNGASVVMALIYGKGDFEKTIRIATMAGWDADCNPSTAGGIIGILSGKTAIPEKWDIFSNRYRNKSVRDLPAWLRISDLAEKTVAVGEEIIEAKGNEIKKDHYIISLQDPLPPSKTEWPYPISELQEKEWAGFRMEKLELDLKLWNPELTIKNCPADGSTGLLLNFQGKRYVFKTTSVSPSKPCTLSFKNFPPLDASEEAFLEISASSGPDSANQWLLSILVNGKPADEVRITDKVPPEYRERCIIPRKNEEIVLYVAKDGSTYFDEDLTQLAQASDQFDPVKKAEPLRIRSAQNNLNLFKYEGKCPPGKEEIRSYSIFTEWTDSHFPIIWLSPGDPHPYGCYWPEEYVPDLPPATAKPIKLRITPDEELPSVPEGGKFVLMHDEGQATVISLPRLSVEPSPWYRLKFDLTPYFKTNSRVTLMSGPAGKSEGTAFWNYVRIARRSKGKR